MHIDRRPSGLWRVTVQVNKQRATATATTLAEVKRLGARLELDLGGQPAANDVTVRELLDQHLDEHPYAATTRADRISARLHLPDKFEDRRVRDVTPMLVDSLYAQLARDRVSVHRIRTIHGLLGSAFKRARRWGWTTSNPTRDALVPAEPSFTVTAPTAVEADAFIAAGDALSPQFGLFLRVAAIVGSRRGETCGLQWPDFTADLGDAGPTFALRVARTVTYTKASGLIVKETKTGQKGARTVAIPAGLAARLQAWKRAQAEAALAVGIRFDDDDDRWIFTKDYANPWHPSSASHQALEARTAAGIAGTVKLKHLRNFVATEMIDAGYSDKTGQGRLGHTRTATFTDRYAAFRPAADAGAADELERRLETASDRRLRR